MTHILSYADLGEEGEDYGEVEKDRSKDLLLENVGRELVQRVVRDLDPQFSQYVDQARAACANDDHYSEVEKSALKQLSDGEIKEAAQRVWQNAVVEGLNW